MISPPRNNPSKILLLLVLLLVTTRSQARIAKQRYGTSVSVDRARHQTQARQLQDSTEVEPWPQKPMGDAACPCLSRDELVAVLGDDSTTDMSLVESNETTIDLYGIGCSAHSLQSDPQCHSNSTAGDESCTGILPKPLDCALDKDYQSWCHRFWCYVDTDHCDLPHSVTSDSNNNATAPTTALEKLYHSYATCGHMDMESTHSQQAQDLRGRRLRTGFNSNTGGWMGSYNPDGSFGMNDDWTGPMVEFVIDAARSGNFSLVQSAPPEWLVNESTAFWGSSSFNLCVYAVSLGYLDLCVSDLTITPERAAATPFFELDSAPIYLLTFLETDEASAWDRFVSQVFKIYQPFHRDSWLFIFLFCIPSLGVLMLFHEYDSPGTAFSEKKDYRVVEASSRQGGRPKIETRSHPMWKQSIKAAYISFLAFFMRSYRVRVFSAGGKLQLLAISCFILLTTTVYTANLAAQFVQDAQKAPVANLEEALQRGMNFCSERKAGETVMNLFGVDGSRLVVDPVSEGGDGLPGFSCPGCSARKRVFDFMQQDHQDPSLYCNAAFVLEEDLEVLQQEGLHCNKTLVGAALTHSHRGFALNEKIADAVTSNFYSLKYSGVLAKHYKEAKPVGSCNVIQPKSSNKRLTIQEMSGIWVATYGFAFVGLLLRVVQRYRESYKKQHKVMWVDQWGNAMPNPKALQTLGFENESTNRNPVEVMIDESRKSHSGAFVFSNKDARIAHMVEQSRDINTLDE